MRDDAAREKMIGVLYSLKTSAFESRVSYYVDFIAFFASTANPDKKYGLP